MYSKGRRRRCGALTVISAPASGNPGRVAFVASRRVGNAVARNRAKRRMRAAYECVTPNPALDLILSATPLVLDRSFDQLVADIEAATHAA